MNTCTLFLVKPGDPSIVSTVSSINVGDTVSWSCAVLSYPVAIVYWTFGSETLTSSDAAVTNAIKAVDSLYEVNSTLTRTITSADNNKNVVCLVEHALTLGSGNKLTSGAVTLTVHGKQHNMVTKYLFQKTRMPLILEIYNFFLKY